MENKYDEISNSSSREDFLEDRSKQDPHPPLDSQQVSFNDSFRNT